MPSSACEAIAPLFRRLGLALAVYVALAWLPWALSEYHLHVLVTSFYYVVLAIGWNLLAGYTGQFSLAHHTFAGVGAYTSALLILHTKVPIVVGVAAGVAVAALLGWGLGTLCLRMRAIYLALATWAFAESVRLLTTDHLTREQRDASTLFLEGAGWGFGGSVDVDPVNPWNVPGRYGWVGGTGTAAHVVPSNRAATILLTQVAMTGPTPTPLMREFWRYAAA